MKHLIIILVGLFLMGCEGEELLEKGSDSSSETVSISLVADYSQLEPVYYNCTTDLCPNINFEALFISIDFEESGYTVKIREASTHHPVSIELKGSFNHQLTLDNGVIAGVAGDFGALGQMSIDVLYDDVQITLDESILSQVSFL